MCVRVLVGVCVCVSVVYVYVSVYAFSCVPKRVIAAVRMRHNTCRVCVGGCGSEGMWECGSVREGVCVPDSRRVCVCVCLWEYGSVGV